ncbi:MAG TPA: tetratricopeptide repeat protein [Pseudolabrys sp.]|nr:tetratricopeptide repeat protein [Pseudolabrys sp.]
MGLRFPTLVFAALLVFAGTAAHAAAPKEPAPKPSAPLVQPPAKLPHVQHGDPTHNLDFLFEALKLAPDDETAKAIEGRIWALWIISRSDTTNLLMTRVKTAVDAKDDKLALKLLDAIIKIKPDYTEAWNRRATIYYSEKDYGKALADIREVLKREPRHFGALAGLGLILQDLGDDKQALEVYRRALAIYPRLQKIPDIVKTLQEKVEGRDI